MEVNSHEHKMITFNTNGKNTVKWCHLCGKFEVHSERGIQLAFSVGSSNPTIDNRDK